MDETFLILIFPLINLIVFDCLTDILNFEIETPNIYKMSRHSRHQHNEKAVTFASSHQPILSYKLSEHISSLLTSIAVHLPSSSKNFPSQ